MAEQSATRPRAWIVYDGQCRSARATCGWSRSATRWAGGELADARKGGPLVDEVRSTGADLDDGMVLKMDGLLYHGEDCVHMLALLSTP